MKISQENPQALRNPWVLGGLAFLCTFLTANAIFIYFAFTTAPSLVVHDFYERGEAYEEVQKRLENEKALGWTGVLMVPNKTGVDLVQQYEAVITGKHSAGLTLDSVVMYAFRPSDAKADFSVDMTMSGNSTYSAETAFPLPGRWEIIVEATRGDDKYGFTREIWINP